MRSSLPRRLLGWRVLVQVAVGAADSAAALPSRPPGWRKLSSFEDAIRGAHPGDARRVTEPEENLGCLLAGDHLSAGVDCFARHDRACAKEFRAAEPNRDVVGGEVAGVLDEGVPRVGVIAR